MPTTAQVNPEQARELFEPILKQGKDILHIAFSSGLSGTYSSVNLAAQELLEEYPDRTICVIDSLCASLGQGLLVHEAVLRKEQGISLEENAQWVENHKKNIIHMFTVDDLFHLHRGGRVSKATAVVLRVWQPWRPASQGIPITRTSWLDISAATAITILNGCSMALPR